MSPESSPSESDLLRRQMDELTALHAVATAATQAESVERLIEWSVKAISTRLYPDVDFGVGLADEENHLLQGYTVIQGKLGRMDFAMGQGIPGQVMSTGQPMRLDDVSKAQGYIALYPEIRSELCVPLISNKRTLGILNAESTRLSAFNEADEQLLMTFAGQLAVAIEKVRLYQQTVRIAERRAVLYHTAQQISASLDIEQVYQAIHKAIAQLMPCEDFLIALLDEQNNEILVVYLYEGAQRLPPAHFPASQGLSGHVIATGQSLKINDFSRDYIEISPVILGEDRTRSALVVPLKVKGKAIGVLSAQSCTFNAYTSDDQEILELLATHAAIAIDNARLFAEVQKLATHDSLTGVYNRHHFFTLAKKEVERAKRYRTPLSLIILDIDYFKQVNDTYGHPAGDQILQQVARLCQSDLREVDIIGRYGGEEFVILLPQTKQEEAQVAAERLREIVETAQIKTGNGPLTISLGVACWSNDYKNVEALLDRADQALLIAKQGKNQVVMYQ